MKKKLAHSMRQVALNHQISSFIEIFVLYFYYNVKKVKVSADVR